MSLIGQRSIRIGAEEQEIKLHGLDSFSTTAHAHNCGGLIGKKNRNRRDVGNSILFSLGSTRYMTQTDTPRSLSLNAFVEAVSLIGGTVLSLCTQILIHTLESGADHVAQGFTAWGSGVGRHRL